MTLDDYLWETDKFEPKQRFRWLCTCGFSHVSECGQSEIDEAIARRVVCQNPACRMPLAAPQIID